LEFFIGLLSEEYFSRLLDLPLPLPSRLVQEGVGELDGLGVLDLEPGVGRYLLYALQGAYTVVGVLGEKAANQGFDLFAYGWRFGEFGLRVKNGLKDLLFLGCVEGGATEEEFVEQNAECVEVDLI
jgi:hypothetical protein